MAERGRRGGLASVKAPGYEERMRKLREGADRHRQRITSAGGKARAGIPRGWTNDAYRAYRKDVRKYAKKIVKRIIPHLSEEQQKVLSEDKMAKEALVTAVTVMRDRTVGWQGKLAAARTILEWTKQKPAQKNEHTIKRAEDFLAALAAKDEQVKVIEHSDDGRPAIAGPSPSQG